MLSRILRSSVAAFVVPMKYSKEAATHSILNGLQYDNYIIDRSHLERFEVNRVESLLVGRTKSVTHRTGDIVN